MAYDYYYDDRYDAPDFEDEESLDWWDTLAAEVVDWMNTLEELSEYEDGYTPAMIADYTERFIWRFPDLVCELYDRWLEKTSFFD